MAHNLRNDPKRLAFVLARYAFAGQVSDQCTSVLELGCSEGVGAVMLHKNKKRYLGIDLDSYAVEAANRNFAASEVRFEEGNFLGSRYGSYDCVVSLDVVEHILPGEDESVYFQTIYENITRRGVCVIGTPNITSTPYASAESMKGHVNMFDADRLKSVTEKFFKTVLIFSMNDEVVHTGYSPMAHYLFAVACNRRERIAL